MLKVEVVDDGEIQREIAKLKEETNIAIRDVADAIFDRSQSKVPVDKGTLKKSGSVIHGEGWSLIGYGTPYAVTVHYGFEDHTQIVKEHTRLLKGGKISVVKEHERRMSAREARKYLDDAIKEVLNEIPPELRDMIEITEFRSDLDEWP